MDTPRDRKAEGVSVWLVEDDPEYRSAFQYLAGRMSGIRCMEVFPDLEAFRSGLVNPELEPPDVILMDVNLPGEDGISGAKWCAEHTEIPVVMLTVEDSQETVVEALRAGANGYLLKNTPIDRLIRAVQEASSGGTLLPAPVATKVLAHFEPDALAEHGMTKREIQVLQLLSTGMQTGEIAEELNLSFHTVDNHLRKVYRKLDVNSGLQAVAKALRAKFIR